MLVVEIVEIVVPSFTSVGGGGAYVWDVLQLCCGSCSTVGSGGSRNNNNNLILCWGNILLTDAKACASVADVHRVSESSLSAFSEC